MYDSQDYQIISINSPQGDGMNFLTKTDENTIKLKCLDQDQDGILELIQYGNLDINEANMIYNYGLQKALESGKYRNKDGLRKFEHIQNDTLFVVETMGSYIDQVYNIFTITDLNSNNRTAFIDQDSDGALDIREKGIMELKMAQSLYDNILQTGIQEAEIFFKREKYIVKFNTIDRSS
jgi:hypothetical protein